MTINNNLTRKEDTSFRDLSYSRWHRTCGKEILASDVDMFEYYYCNGEKKAVAVSDLKAVLDDSKILKPIELSRSSISFNKWVADRLELPFFLIITYLTENYTNPMVYVVPANYHASCWINKVRCPKKSKGPQNGIWMTPQTHCKMLWALRGITPPKEIIEQQPNNFTTYKLPKIC